MTSQTKALLRRQKILESLGEKLATSTASKVPTEQAELLPENHRHLAGKTELEKSRSAALRKMVPAFLRNAWTKRSSILKLKLLAWSLRLASSSFWWRQRKISAMLATKSSSPSILKPWLAAWQTRPSSLRLRKNTFPASSSGSGENISAITTCLVTKPSRRFIWRNIFCGTGQASRRSDESTKN